MDKKSINNKTGGISNQIKLNQIKSNQIKEKNSRKSQ